MQKVEVYCGIITTHLVVSERLAKDGLSMQESATDAAPFRSLDKIMFQTMMMEKKMMR